MNPPLSSDQATIQEALNVVSTVVIFKWIAVVVISLVGAASAIAGGVAAENPTAGVLIMAGAAMSALVAWVLFGLVQHTLGMLALIARNTTHP